MRARVVDALSDIPAAQWDALHDGRNPFVSHAFLAGLERHRCLRPQYGWTPRHLTLWDGAELVAAMPAYRKTNSHGEFVFDHAWAHAFARHGLDYFPKWLCAVPYTPVTGPRLLARDDTGPARIARRPRRDDAPRQACHRPMSISMPKRKTAHSTPSWLARIDVQYHWRNDAGWADFDGFLAAMDHKHRKNIRQERAKVRRAGVDFRVVHGDEASDSDLAAMHGFYLQTFRDYGNTPALTLEFFRHLATSMPRQLVLILAERDGRAIAGALCLRGGDTLYGRYWGASEAAARPAFRDLLLPGHRLLPARRPARVRARRAGRTQAGARIPADAGAQPPLDRRPGVRRGDRPLVRRGSRLGTSLRLAARARTRRFVRVADDAACQCSTPTRRRHSRRSTPPCANPTACWRWAATCRPARLLNAYRHGIFPWFSQGEPILWWSPDPRMVFRTDGVRLSSRFRRAVAAIAVAGARRHGIRRRDRGLRAHPATGRARHLDHGRRCAPPTSSCTGSAMRTASRSSTAQRLVGGIYGVAIGRMFFGESMFSAESGGSKVALAALAHRLRGLGLAADRRPGRESHTSPASARKPGHARSSWRMSPR